MAGRTFVPRGLSDSHEAVSCSEKWLVSRRAHHGVQDQPYSGWTRQQPVRIRDFWLLNAGCWVLCSRLVDQAYWVSWQFSALGQPQVGSQEPGRPRGTRAADLDSCLSEQAEDKLDHFSHDPNLRHSKLRLVSTWRCLLLLVYRVNRHHELIVPTSTQIQRSETSTILATYWRKSSDLTS